MAIHVAHNPFIRGSYHRACIANAHKDQSCRCCGTRPMRLYLYVYVQDDHAHQATNWRTAKLFCNMACHRAYYQ